MHRTEDHDTSALKDKPCLNQQKEIGLTHRIESE